MIEGRVRELVADVAAASDAWSARERIDAIAELEAAVAMLQGVGNVEAVAYVEQRRTADKAARTGSDTAGRGAPVELAMARGVTGDGGLPVGVRPSTRRRPPGVVGGVSGRAGRPVRGQTCRAGD